MCPTDYPDYVRYLTMLKSPFPSFHVFRKEALTLQMLSSLSDQRDDILQPLVHQINRLRKRSRIVCPAHQILAIAETTPVSQGAPSH